MNRIAELNAALDLILRTALATPRTGRPVGPWSPAKTTIVPRRQARVASGSIRYLGRNLDDWTVGRR